MDKETMRPLYDNGQAGMQHVWRMGGRERIHLHQHTLVCQLQDWTPQQKLSLLSPSYSLTLIQWACSLTKLLYLQNSNKWWYCMLYSSALSYIDRTSKWVRKLVVNLLWEWNWVETSVSHSQWLRFKGAPDPVAREVYRGLLCLRKIL